MSTITLTHGELRRHGRSVPILEHPSTTEQEAFRRFLSLDDRLVGWVEYLGTRLAVRFASSYELARVFDDEFRGRLVRLYVVHSYFGNHAAELSSLN